MKVTDNDMPDDLLAKYLTGKTTPVENFRAKEWINTNDANREYYEQLKIKAAPDNHIHDNDAEAWIRLQNLISKNHGGHIDKPEYKFKARWIQLLATVALIGLISYFIRTRLYSNVTLNFSSGTEVVSDDLPDGTKITLNTNSQLSYPARFTGNKRSVNLDGEAFFEVIDDKVKPFIINLKSIFVNANGASVDVKNNNGQTEITVVKGSVKINGYGQELLIKAGEMVRISASSATFYKENNKGNNAAAWAVVQE